MGMMTGRYPHAIGAPFNLPNPVKMPEGSSKGIDTSEPLISTVLQQAGYTTGAIGKWHMGIASEFHPNNRGFDDYFGFLGGGHMYFPEKFTPIYKRQRARGIKVLNEYVMPLQRNGIEVEETEYITDALSREACGFIDRASTSDTPFFLYLAYNAPHSPLEATKEDKKLFSGIKDEKRRTYAAMVYAVDRGVGKIVETLKENEELNNTLIVFLSDNGGKIGLGANNAPLREGKGSTFEGGFRVPMFFHFPQQIPPNQSFKHPVTALDFYPTFASLAHADIPTNKHLDGSNIWSSIAKGENPRPDEPIFALRHRAGFSDVGIRQDRWKAVRVGNQAWQLFDIEADIGEKKNIRAQHPVLLKELVSKAQKWSNTHVPPRWFDSPQAKNQWESASMPKFDKTFSTP